MLQLLCKDPVAAVPHGQSQTGRSHPWCCTSQHDRNAAPKIDKIALRNGHVMCAQIKRRPPRRSEKVKQTMGNKYRKRRDKAFIRRKGKFARLGRNMRKT